MSNLVFEPACLEIGAVISASVHVPHVFGQYFFVSAPSADSSPHKSRSFAVWQSCSPPAASRPISSSTHATGASAGVAVGGVVGLAVSGVVGLEGMGVPVGAGSLCGGG